jgi:hypothetical protein
LEEQFERIVQLGLERFRAKGEIPLLLLRGGRARAPTIRRRSNLCGVVQGKTPAIDVKGDVYGCAMLIESVHAAGARWFIDELRRLRIGNLQDPDFRERFEAWVERAGRSRLLAHRNAKRSSSRRCRDCPVEHECAVCPVSIGSTEGNQDPNRIPDFQCAVTRISLEARDRFNQEIGTAPPEDAAERAGAGVDPLARFLGLSELPPAMERVRVFGELAGVGEKGKADSSALP